MFKLSDLGSRRSRRDNNTGTNNTGANNTGAPATTDATDATNSTDGAGNTTPAATAPGAGGTASDATGLRPVVSLDFSGDGSCFDIVSFVEKGNAPFGKSVAVTCQDKDGTNGRVIVARFNPNNKSAPVDYTEVASGLGKITGITASGDAVLFVTTTMQQKVAAVYTSAGKSAAEFTTGAVLRIDVAAAANTSAPAGPLGRGVTVVQTKLSSPQGVCMMGEQMVVLEAGRGRLLRITAKGAVEVMAHDVPVEDYEADGKKPLNAPYAYRAVHFHPNGGQFHFAWPPARPPHGGASYVW